MMTPPTPASLLEEWASSLDVRPGRDSSLSESVYVLVRDALKRGELPTGTRLIEGELARLLAVSRTPVRESLRRLESDGLVKPGDGRGYIVADLMADAVHVFAIRARLEGLAASFAAGQITVPQLEQIQAIQRDMVGLVEAEVEAPGRFAELNHQFHSEITRAAASPRLESIVNQLHPEYLGYQVVRTYDLDQRRRSTVEHQAILDALWVRNAQLADELVQRHFEHGRAIVLERIRRGEMK